MKAFHWTSITALLFGFGCSSEPSWRDDVERHNLGKEESIRAYENQGLTAKEAEDAWWMREITYRTETAGREDVIRE